MSNKLTNNSTSSTNSNNIGANKTAPSSQLGSLPDDDDDDELSKSIDLPETPEKSSQLSDLSAGRWKMQPPTMMDQKDNNNNNNKPMSTGLLYYSREPLPLKDFASEVRAPMDVEQFAHQAELVLDMNEISMEDIVDSMLSRVIASEPALNGCLNEVRDSLFLNGSSSLMARTIQGVCGSGSSAKPSPTSASTLSASDNNNNNNNNRNNSNSNSADNNDELEHDQTWLCALCNLSQITRRHMIISRFRRPVNMGENAREVRIFMLVLTPCKEKDTKSSLETGRTFATMLADTQFRRKLLSANNSTEFKALMVVRAQQLGQMQKGLKNRHKYQLDPALRVSLSLAALNEEVANEEAKSSSNNKRPASQMEQSNDRYRKNPHTSKLFELITPVNDVGEGQQHHREKGFCDDRVTKRHQKTCCQSLEFGYGLWRDFRRRLAYYPSDYYDAFVGPPRTVQKVVATTWFLYFGILLPTIAFSSLNTQQTHGHMGDLRKAIIGQAFGGLCFALLGGQPLVIIMTTAPLCLYTKVIHQMCIDYGFHFPAMYAAVGLWNGFFLIIYSLFGFSKLMKWCTRSTEEIFALFIVVAFITDAGKDLIKNFKTFYSTEACQQQNIKELAIKSMVNTTTTTTTTTTTMTTTISDLHNNLTSSESISDAMICRRETSLLFVLLMLGTLWLSVTLYRFKKTSYLSAGKRELLSDYALPMAVILMSFVGSYVFDEIYVESFPTVKEIHFERAQIELLTLTGILTAMGLGFTLSLLFFMDQNISAAMVNAPQNGLKKGSAYHYDLFVVGILNGVLTLYGLPMMHGVLPHSPLHVRSLADIEEQVEEGHLREVIVNCRETRVTAIVSHILILCSVLLIPYPIAYIPRAVLNGLFLYMAVTSLDGLHMFERILLLFTEQSQYPPNHYIRRCPQRKIHRFTMLQLIQLLVMCLFGFSPINVVEMFFPVIILLMIPFRHKIVPKFIGHKYLNALDGKQH